MQRGANAYTRKSRNGFWIQALHNIDADKHVSFKILEQDAESSQPSKAYRSLQPVYHLKFGIPSNDQEPNQKDFCVNEDSVSLAVIINVVLSELVSVLTSLIFGLKLINLGFCFYVLIPLLLKLLLIGFIVR